jgi:hypothetical protein
MQTALANALTHEAPASIMGTDDRINEASAWACYWQAGDITNTRHAMGGRSMFGIPPHWTCQLLMHKAGVPREFIAKAFSDDPDRVRRRLWALIGLMIFAPYAAEIEALMKNMLTYTDMRLSYEQIELVENEGFAFTDRLDDES